MDYTKVMRPKILIAMHYMELGGAEAALLGLLQSVDPDRAEVDVFIYAHRGELMQYVNSEECGVWSEELAVRQKFRLLPEVEVYAMLEEPISLLLKKGYWKLALSRLWGKYEWKRNLKNNTTGLEDNSAVTYQQHRTIKCLPQINPEVVYDLAISFLTPHYIVHDKVHAKKKLGWIHTDYTNVFINREMELRMWERMDVISSISPDVSERFAEVFPSLKDRIINIENILSPSFIRKRSEAPCPIFENDHSLKLLTIGRYSKAKKMEDIPYFCRNMIESGQNIHWYIIGYGSTFYEQQLKDSIEKEGMQDRVIMLGKQSNPYPYIRCCDVYVQPSLYEGKSITVREAQILCKPVIVTNYPTAPSQVQDGIDGIIVPLEREACAEEMIATIRNDVMKDQLISYLSEHDYGNESEIEKIYKLCE